MMLAKVAERVYWTARYLERVENTTRLITVYNQLLFDLPKDVDFSWYGLIDLNKADDFFKEKYQNRSEKNIIKFLLADKSYPSSILNTLQFVRENIRTTRDVLPEYIWILVNELNLYVEINLQQGINRNKRLEFLEGILHGCFQINGLLSSCMSKDEAWYFRLLGKKIERADMTSRLLDAGATAFHHLETKKNDINLHQVVWGNLLRVLSAEQSFRRNNRSSLKGEAVINYLLKDETQPSSLMHCLIETKLAAKALPHSRSIVQQIESSIDKLDKINPRLDEHDLFNEFINEHQLSIAHLNHSITKLWFAERYL